ncbi:hypothetical protein EVAR_19343_1 [Eumeta japonica]|uniref:Uncharacterized protein n=1 Tax=Eumeta variegata TaxID=151549 RepID=A0A4C1TRC3_EUMVA|nr:hypothetical protein EVAR_19343_1 [Eumeta japonica]
MHPRLELGIFCTENIRDSRCSTATVKPAAKYQYIYLYRERNTSITERVVKIYHIYAAGSAATASVDAGRPHTYARKISGGSDPNRRTRSIADAPAGAGGSSPSTRPPRREGACLPCKRSSWLEVRAFVTEQDPPDDRNLPNGEGSSVNVNIGIQHALEGSSESNLEGKKSNTKENHGIIVS